MRPSHNHPFHLLYRVILITALLVVGLSLTGPATPPAAEAQSDEVLARIDQAMEHLSDFLGFEINRRSHFWQWAERVWDNEAMDCPVPGQEYPDQLTRGYRIRITVDETVYDYRTTPDGSILLLCIDGQPDPSSIGVDTTTLGTPPSTETVDLPSSSDWAWFYNPNLETLYLFNPDGLQAQINRPRLTNEDPDPTRVRIGISRDSRYMIVATQLISGRWSLGIYSFETGSYVEQHVAEVDEQVNLPASTHDLTLSFNPDNTRVAVGLSPDRPDVSPWTWRVIVFELASGTPVATLERSSPILTSLPNPEAFQRDLVFPRVVYYDDDQNIHIQLVQGFTEGAHSYPVFAWNPDTDAVTTSPYTFSIMDVNPVDDQMVWPDRDDGQPALPPEGPFTSNNVIYTGLPTELASPPTEVWFDSSRYHFDTFWAAGGQLIVFRATDNTFSDQWKVLNLSTNAQTILPNTVTFAVGSANGFWTLSSGDVAYHAGSNPAAGNPLWDGSDELEAVWTLLPGSSFGLTRINSTSTTGTPPVATGPSLCTGAPPSVVEVGVRAQVSISPEGERPLPLRLRDAPAGNFLESIPEGTDFSVIGGPQCADGYTWWQIRLADGTTGWSAEGDADSYFMERLP